MYYYVGEVQNQADEHNATINIGDEITPEEVETLNKAFSITGDYHAIKQIYDIVVENGLEFKSWMKSERLQSKRDAGLSSKRLILLSNKLALNYASSIKTFLDMTQRLLKHRKPESVKDFLALTNKFYDDHLEYRFWANFRNYVVHCSFPYSIFHEAVGSNCEVRCSKKHLLKFDNWKHSKADIEQMPEYVDLPGMVDRMSSLIYALYLQFFYYVASDAFSGYNTYQEFLKKHSVRCPVIFKTEKPISREEGFVVPSMQPLPIKEMMDVFNTMNQHPSINIKITQL